MKKALSLIVIAILIMGAGSLTNVWAEGATGGSEGLSKTDSMDSSTSSRSQSSASGFQAYQSSDITGMSVKNQQGEDLGKVSDLVFDSDGRIAFVVVQSGGFIGMGGKKVALPLASIQMDQNRQNLVLDISRQQIETARAFDENILNSRTAATDVYRHFGQQPRWDSGTQRESIQPSPSTPESMQPESSAPDSSVPTRPDLMKSKPSDSNY